MLWKDLTKKEKSHLREMGVRTLEQFKHTHASQEKTRKENNHNPVLEPCWECKDIARKLNI